MHRPQRGSIFLEDSEILDHQDLGAGQHLLRMLAPKCAAAAKPGMFVHLQCDPCLPLRRPLSLMRVAAEVGWVELLYKVVGEGTRLLSRRGRGERLSLLGPIGRPFELHADRPRALLVGGGIGIPPMVFLADQIRRHEGWKALAVLGSEIPFPFKARPSQIVIPGMPEGTIAAMPLLEDWGIASRLASLRGYAGCFEGYVTELARRWLDALAPEQRTEVEIFACGPHPMLEAVAGLARDYGLPCQVSMEEFMACGVGGCAGCTIEVTTPDGPAMQRVCVDGPVFEAAGVFPG